MTDPRRGSLPRLVAYGLLAVVAASLALVARTLPASRWEPLGAGTFPSLVFGALALLCAIGLLSELLARPALTQSVGQWFREQRLVVFVLSSFAVYVLLLPGLGFATATLLFLLVTQLRLAPRRVAARWWAVGLSLLFSFGLAWLFANVFAIYLPRSQWFG